MKTFKVLAMFLFIGVIALSCKKEVGPTGATGKDGKDGKDGNANVITSPWIVANFETPSSTRRSFSIPTPELTQEIRDDGVILVYGRFDGSEVWAVPVVFPYFQQSFSFYSPSVDKIIILCDAIDGITPLGMIYLEEFRYVFIPSSAMSQIPVGTDLNNYKDVSKIFSLD